MNRLFRRETLVRRPSLGSILVFLVSLGFTSGRAIAEESPWRVTGFLQLRAVAASRQMQSFSQNNLSAVTAVSNPILSESPESVRSSLQVAQSRLGAEYVGSAGMLGRFEFDFIDFTKSTPTTAAVPRVRRAAIEYLPEGTSFHFLFGQDWDLVSPLAPFTYNWVGHAFESGDIGFMRLQVQLRYDATLEHEIGWAIGFPKSNISASDTADETSTLPVLEARYRYHWSSWQAGTSALYARLKTDAITRRREQTWVTNAFVESKTSESLVVRAESYIGQNTAGVGLLGLSQATAAYGSPREVGGFVSGRWLMTEKSAIYGFFGGAKNLDASETAPLYTRSPSLARSTSNGPGIIWNAQATLGMDRNLKKNFRIFVQASALKTRHALLGVDLFLNRSIQKGMVGECGVQLDL